MFAYALFGQVVKYSNDFLSIGVGAEASAMANAVVAGVNDVTAGYWNPAGLSNITNTYEFGLMHNEYFAGIAKYDYFGSAYKIDSSSVLGVSIIRFGVDDIPNTIELMDSEGNFDYSRMSRFSVADYAFITSFSKKLPIEGLSVGANAKIIYRNVGKFAKAYGFGLDAGIQYQKKQFQMGVLLRDITSTFNAWSFNEDELRIETIDSTFNLVPENNLELTLPRMIIGTAYKIKINPKFVLKGEIDLDITADGKRNTLIRTNLFSIDPYLGLELDYINLAFLRFGIGNAQNITDFDEDYWTFQPNLGLGIQYKNFAVDYALTNIGNLSAVKYSNVISIRYAFNGN